MLPLPFSCRTYLTLCSYRTLTLQMELSLATLRPSPCPIYFIPCTYQGITVFPLSCIQYYPKLFSLPNTSHPLHLSEHYRYHVLSLSQPALPSALFLAKYVPAFKIWLKNMLPRFHPVHVPVTAVISNFSQSD